MDGWLEGQKEDEKWTDLICSLLLHFFSFSFCFLSHDSSVSSVKEGGRQGGGRVGKKRESIKLENYITATKGKIHKSQDTSWEIQSLEQKHSIQRVTRHITKMPRKFHL